jgi:hypothetical protein
MGMFVDYVPLEGVRRREKSMIGSFVARGRTWSVPMKKADPPKDQPTARFSEIWLHFGCNQRRWWQFCRLCRFVSAVPSIV